MTRTLGYLYDAAGNRTRLTYPDGNFVNYYRTDSGAFYYAGSNGSASPQFYPVRDAAGRLSVLNRWMTTAAAWVDVTREGIAQPTASFGHGPECSGIRKVVKFQLRLARFPSCKCDAVAIVRPLAARTGSQKINR